MRGASLYSQATSNQLRLAFIRSSRQWKVWAPLHGTSKFRWWLISDTTAIWYVEQFLLKTEEFDDEEAFTSSVNVENK